MPYRRFDIACMVVLLATLLVACDRPQTAVGAPFKTEDECEDAGMSDAFCDRMFPELEDFMAKPKKVKPKIVTAGTPTRPSAWAKPAKSPPFQARSNRPSSTSKR